MAAIYNEAGLKRAAEDRARDTLREIGIATRDMVLEEIACLHDDEAGEYFRLRDPGTANAHRSWARRLRAMKIGPAL